MPTFSNVAKEVMRARANFSCPESMKKLDSVITKDMYSKIITIDKIVVSNRLKKDKDTKEVIKTKDGKDIYQPIVFIAFDKTKFFATKSAILVEQLEGICGKKLTATEKIDFDVDGVSGCKVKVSTQSVKYRDGKYYDQIIFEDA